jgi:hypothetical protein
MSSLDSTASDESSSIPPTPHYYGSVSSLLSGIGHGGGNNNLKDHYGSITSLASSTSLISPQVEIATFVFARPKSNLTLLPAQQTKQVFPPPFQSLD